MNRSDRAARGLIVITGAYEALGAATARAAAAGGAQIALIDRAATAPAGLKPRAVQTLSW